MTTSSPAHKASQASRQTRRRARRAAASVSGARIARYAPRKFARPNVAKSGDRASLTRPNGRQPAPCARLSKTSGAAAAAIAASARRARGQGRNWLAASKKSKR